MESKDTVVARFVDPKGDILNDNDSGVDYLGNSIYAEALARRIEHVNAPITIGLFAAWGSGKTFLVNHVLNLLRKYQRQGDTLNKISEPSRNFWRSRCFCRAIFLIVLVALIVMSIIWALFPDLFLFWISKEDPIIIALNESLPSTNSSKYYYIYHVDNNENVTNDKELSHYEYWRNFSRYFSIAFLCFAMVFVFLAICSNTSYWSKAFFSNFRLICYVAFTKIPIMATKSSVVKEHLEEDQVIEMTSSSDEIEEDSSKPIRYIFVTFNAWQYAGSDTIWAGIVTNLTDAIESEFGRVTARLFRVLQPELISRDVKTEDAVSTVLFLKTETDLMQNEVLDILKNFGVVKYFKEYRTWMEYSKKTRASLNKTLVWFVVEYSNYKEAKLAKESLELEGLTIQFVDPFKNLKTPQNSKDKNGNHIEMDLINRKSTDELKLLKMNKKSKSIAKSRENGFFNHFIRHPKTTCFFPVLFCWVLLLFTCISLPVVTYVLASLLDLHVFSKYPRAVPVVVQIFAWLPSTIAVFVVVFKFVWAMWHSQRSRINKALDGAKGTMESGLGFMDKVKTEVEIVSTLVKCVEFSHNKKYKVVITVDDLDRLPPDKVISVLQAVSILLSDRSSPFICLVALDSRVAVKCIEQEISASLLKANVNGHEYLKKIINLPFCLPEVSTKNKKVFVTGLIDQSDKIKKMRIPKPEPDNTEEPPMTKVDQQRRGSTRRNSMLIDSRRNSVVKETDLSDLVVTSVDHGRNIDNHRVDFDTINAGLIGQTGSMVDEQKLKHRKNPLSNETFIFECRKHMLSNKMILRHLVGNPRNMKRIFNVLSMTATIINCCENEKLKSRNIKSMVTSSRSDEVNKIKLNGVRLDFVQQKVQGNNQDEANIRNVGLAEDLVLWVVLTDQWPYRMSYILQIIDDADQRSKSGRRNENINDDVTLFGIYKNLILPEIEKIKKNENENNKSLLYLDSNPEVFYNFLLELSEQAPYIDKSRVKLLRKYTTNLDHSLKQSIAFQRDSIDLNDDTDCTSDGSKDTNHLNNISGEQSQNLTFPNKIGKKREKSEIQKRIDRRKNHSVVSLNGPGVVSLNANMLCDDV